MAKFLLIVAIAFLAIYDVQSLQRVKNIRFPGRLQHTQRLRFPARQEAAPTPYPAAGARPVPPFELPTEEEASFPDPTYGPPDETYGPPDETYGPPDETYGPPEETNEAPDQTYGPPEQTYGPPDQTYGPPDAQSVDIPAQLVDTTAIKPIDIREFFPKTSLTLPHPERLVDFRSRPKFQRIQSETVLRRPIQTTANIFEPDFIEKPKSRLTLPYVERLNVFRKVPIRQPSIGATLSTNKRPQSFQPSIAATLNANKRPQRKRPTKLQATLQHRPQSIIDEAFAQLQPIERFPITFADGTTIFSDQLQSWLSKI